MYYYRRIGDDLMKNRLKIIRAEENLTQEALAEKAGISRVAVSNIEKEKVVPSGYTIQRLCNALNRKVSDIFSDFM